MDTETTALLARADDLRDQLAAFTERSDISDHRNNDLRRQSDRMYAEWGAACDKLAASLRRVKGALLMP